MSRRRDQEGFTLVELMIVVVIMGLLSTVIARFFMSSNLMWLFSSASIQSQQKARIARDNINSGLRQASAASVVITRYDSSQPPMSMISFVDARGNSMAFWQKDMGFYQGSWITGTAGRTVTKGSYIIPFNLQAVTFYYPNIKDTRRVSYSLYTIWDLKDNSKYRDPAIQMVGDVDIRNP